MSTPLHRKAFLSIIAILFLSIVSILFVFVAGGRYFISSTINDDMINVAVRLRAEIDQQLRNYLLMLSAVGTSYQQAHDIERSLLALQGTNPIIKRAFILDDHGVLKALLPYQKKSIGENFSSETFFVVPFQNRKATANVSSQLSFCEGINFVLTVPMVMLSETKSGLPRRGVLGIVIPLTDFFGLYKELQIAGWNGLYAISDETVFYQASSSAPDETTQQTIREEAKDMTPETGVRIITSADGSGASIIASVYRDPVSNLLIGVAVPHDVASSVFTRFLWIVLGSAVIVFSLSTLIIFMLIQRFHTRFQKVVTITRDIAEKISTLDDTDAGANTGDDLDELIMDLGLIYQSQRRGREKLEDAYRQISTHELMKRDVSVAQQIQQAMIPSTFPANENFEVSGFYEPAREVGGDVLDCFEHQDGRISLLIADVSGKGIPAALVMAQTKIMFRILASSQNSTLTIMEKANSFLRQNLRKNTFVTAFFGQYDPRSRKFTYCNAGHNPPFLYRQQSGTIVEITGDESTCLGAWSEFVGEERSLILEPGDSLLLYTDGATEATRGDGEMFEEIRLRKVFEKFHTLSAQQIIGKMKESIEYFIQDAVLYDDLTMIVLKIPLAVGEQSAQ